MSYLTQAAMAQNATLTQRVAQCAAQQGIANPDSWTQENRREWAAAPGWDAAWESGLETNKKQTGYDPGADEACITDQMILSWVQANKPPVTP